MKLGLYCSPLGGVTPPFGHSRKEIGTLVALGGLALAAGGTIASVASQNSANNTNLDAVREANAANLQIARETNEMSQQQFNQNMNWSKEQFGLQRQYALEDREYNSIENQVRRAVAAGINPAAVIGNGSAAHQTTPVGSVGTPSQSNFQVPHMEAGHVEPVNYDFSGISESVGHAVDAYNNSRMINAQVENIYADTQIKRHQDLTTVAEGLGRVRKLYSENQSLLASANLSEATRKKIEKEQEKIEQEMKYFEQVKDDLARGVRLGNTRVEREMKHIDFQEEQMADESKRAWTELGIKRALANSQIKLNEENLKVFESVAAHNWELAKNEYYKRGSIKEGALAIKIHRELFEQYQGEKVRELGYRNSTVWHRDAWDLANYLSGAILNGLQTIPKFK